MTHKIAVAIPVVLFLSSLCTGVARAQVATSADDATCMPTADQVRQQLRMFASRLAKQSPQETSFTNRNVRIKAIPGVVSAGAMWTKIWQEGGNSADGIIAEPDGSVLVAQEDYDAVLRIDANGNSSVLVANAKGVGSLSMDRYGTLYGGLRTERPGSTKPDKNSIENAIVVLAPVRKVIADKWADGTMLTIRPNDLAADGHSGAYFTSGCLYYADAHGATVMAGKIRTNGIVFSLDYKTLYVTNGAEIIAFDVRGPGRLARRRDFAMLPKGSYGDGMAIDSKSRLYVSSNAGVQVFDKAGKYLGVIPTPRGIISVVFAGAGKKTLYAVGSGAEDANGQPIRQGPQHTAATIYKLPMLAQGPSGRAK
ncbi:MAG TPA: SMP-30/gluconolactonase/LRE family protein [Candidatus Dormibacteraeota bacterium]|nr:SMP-30/gluconolactonase/LRE family protein [Candidatus Dormibacteraeota bacterium]